MVMGNEKKASIPLGLSLKSALGKNSAVNKIIMVEKMVLSVRSTASEEK